MDNKTLAEKLAGNLLNKATTKENQASSQKLALENQKAGEQARRAKVEAQQAGELKSLSPLFAEVSDEDILKAVEGSKELTIKTWTNYSVFEYYEGRNMPEVLKETEGGKSLIKRFEEIGAEAVGINYTGSGFLRNIIKINLSWDQSKFEETVQQQSHKL
jgi:hypothetical protein